MTQATYPPTTHHAQTTLAERATTLGSWAFGGAIFLTVGWLAMEPDDPLGAVSVQTRTNALVMLLQAAALGGVASALGTVLAGRRREDIGTFATALGMAAVSLKGGTAGYLLVDGAEIGSTVGGSLALKFALESVGWFAVVAFSLGVSAFLTRWLYVGSGPQDAGRSCSAAAGGLTLAGFDAPGVGALLFDGSADQRTAPREGIKHTAVAVAVGLIAIGFFSGGLSSRSIQHGQVCFVVAAALSVGCYTAHRLAPVRSALWSIMAVLAIPVIGYLWASVRPATPGLPPTAPSSDFMRVLPIQYISVGTAAALAMFWHMCTITGEVTSHTSSGADGAVSPDRRV